MPTQVEKVANSPAPAANLTKDSKAAPADTISMSSQLRQTLDEVKKENVQKVEAPAANNSGKSDVSMPKVQFAYDNKGTLTVKYMDASNNLIYQTPSELMLRMKEDADKSVDTKA